MVRVLAYHSLTPHPGDPLGVAPDMFRRQILWLRDTGWQSLGLMDWVEMVEQGEAPTHRSCVVTFDDAYADNLEIAAPILRELGFSATVFAVTDSLADGRLREHGQPLPAASSSRRSFTWKDAEEWCRLGFEIGSHTTTHRPLTGIDLRQRDDELRESRSLLQSRLGLDDLVICYPYGAVDGEVAEAARAVGYRGGVVTPRRAGVPVTPWTIHRVGIYGPDDLRRFRFKLGQIFPVLRKARFLMRRQHARFASDFGVPALAREAIDG